MPVIRTELEMRLWTALKVIGAYYTPSKLRKKAEAEYGLSYEEALEMSYENIQATAIGAVRNVTKPRQKSVKL